MSSYIENATIIGVKTEEIFKNIDDANKFVNNHYNEYSVDGFNIYGQEFEGEIINSYIGFSLEKNNDGNGHIVDENYFQEKEKEIKRKKELFFQLFNEEGYIIFTYYRY